jgi:carboxylesterase type B
MAKSNQSDSAGKFTSEDCLYLNVIRPAGYEGQNLPVLVWVHVCYSRPIFR